MAESAGNGNAGSSVLAAGGTFVDGFSYLLSLGAVGQLGSNAGWLGISSPSGEAPGDSTGTVATAIQNAQQDLTSSLPSSTSITFWMVLIVIGILGFAYITREVAG